MPPDGRQRVEIIPPIHGKVTAAHKISEPDIQWIIERWLERHPEIVPERDRIRVTTGQWTTNEGLKTEVMRATVLASDRIADYDPTADEDLYRYWLAEDRYWEEG